MSSTLLVEKNGQPEPFLADLLFIEILLALQHRKDRYTAAREVTSTVVAELLAEPDKPLFRPSQISLAVSRVLARLDEAAWLRYTAEHPSLQS
jgi:transcriptional regulator NrdR family protein